MDLFCGVQHAACACGRALPRRRGDQRGRAPELFVAGERHETRRPAFLLPHSAPSPLPTQTLATCYLPPIYYSYPSGHMPPPLRREPRMV